MLQTQPFIHNKGSSNSERKNVNYTRNLIIKCNVFCSSYKLLMNTLFSRELLKKTPAQ